MKPQAIETMINTTALVLTSYGASMAQQRFYLDAAGLIASGMLLEFIKYYGRHKKWFK